MGADGPEFSARSVDRPADQDANKSSALRAITWQVLLTGVLTGVANFFVNPTVLLRCCHRLKAWID